MLYRNRYVIPSIRLQNWDYRSPGYYFITICAQQRWREPFGYIRNGYVCLSDMGAIVAQSWLQTPIIRPYIGLDAWVVMPDHFHAIVHIIDYRKTSSASDTQSVETHGHASLQNINMVQQNTNMGQTKRLYNRFGVQSNNLPAIIRGFKGTTTKQIHHDYPNHFFQWQPRYFEKIIRSQRELSNVRRYIQDNPKKWYNHDR